MTTNSVLKFLGRSALGAPIAQLGWGAMTNPGRRVDVAAPTLNKIREVVPLPFDDETAVRINGALMVAASATMALGIAPKTSALALIGSMAVTTHAGHPFWEIPEDRPQERIGQQIHFAKNISMIGGLLHVLGAHSQK